MKRAVAILATVLVGACGQRESPPGSAAVPSARRASERPFVVFSQPSVAIDQLEVPVATPATVGSQPSAEIMSSDAPDVVSVEASGALVAHRNGTAQIRSAGTGSVLGVTVSATGTIRAEPSKLRLRAGEASHVRVVSGDGLEIPPAAVRWWVSALEIARVQDGVVRGGEGSGTAILTAEYAGASTRVTVEVAAPSVGPFVVTPAKPRLHVGGLASFQAVSRGGPIDATWTSSSERVLAHLQGNIFRANARGEAVVCAVVAQRRACTTVGVAP